MRRRFVTSSRSVAPVMHGIRFETCSMVLAVAVWAAAVGAGLRQIWTYETTAGQVGSIPVRWPDASSLPFEGRRARLLLFVHPRCPCTRATLEELARALAHGGDRADADVLFLQPAGMDEAWVRGDLWRRALEIPGVRAIADEGGRERLRFGIETSGHVLLYSPGGDLVFSGGITAARGHEGDNAGAEAIAECLRGGRSKQARTPVFGCALSNP